jgi:pimeloyl-ACP methyl ester carboxylesterase
MQAMEREIPQALLAEVPRAGHLPMLDNPEGFEKAVLGFCLGEAG